MVVLLHTKHLLYIAAAYGIGFVVLAGLFLCIFRQRLALRALLNALEEDR